MLKIFVVEDETAIRKGIIKYIERGGDELQIVGEEREGEQAYLKILEAKPDILITDIRMPYMDGLELGEELKKRLPDLKIIIISGYGEFDYASRAIKIGVVDYLLKPIFEDKLLAAIRKAQEEIIRERENEQIAVELEQEKEQKKEMERWRLFEDLISGKYSSVELYDKARELGISLASDYYNIAVVGNWHRKGEQNSDGKSHELQRRLKEILAGCEFSVFFPRGNESSAILVKGETAEEVEEHLRWIESRLYSRMGDRGYFMGVGIVVGHFRELPGCYYQADKAYSRRYFNSASSVCYAQELTEIPYRQEAAVSLEQVDIKKWGRDSLELFLKKGLKKEIKGFMDHYLECVGRDNMESLVFRQYMLIDIQLEVIRFLDELGAATELEGLAGEEQTVSRYIKTLDETRRYIEFMLEKCLDVRDGVAENKYEAMIGKAKAYVREHYSDDISLNVVAAYVGISPNHFSRIFSQESGSTFIEYLTQVRMEQAKEMLRCTNKKITEISHEIGYRDNRYFYTLFKKNVGCTPKEYRKNK